MIAVVLTQLTLGAELLSRTVTVADGLPSNQVRCLGQDDEGYLWLGGTGMVSRFDGQRVQTWPTPIEEGAYEVVEMMPIGGGGMAVRWGAGPVHTISSAGQWATLAGPDGEPTLATDLERLDGDLLLARADGVWRRDADARWTRLLTQVDGAVPRRLGLSPVGLLVGTAESWYRWRFDGQAERLLAEGTPTFAFEPADGVTWLLVDDPGRVYLERPGGVSLVEALPLDRLLGAAVFGDSLWFGDGRAVRVASPDGRVEVFPKGRAGFRSRGIFLLDAEGAMWAAGFDGLGSVSVPDLRIWTHDDGLWSQAQRFPTAFAGQIWATDWFGLSRVDGDGAVGHPTERRVNGPLCHAFDALWALGADRAATGETAWQRWDTRGAHAEFPGPRTSAWTTGCARAADGGVWFVAGGRIWHTRGLEAPADLGPSPLGGRGMATVVQRRAGELWVAGGDRACVWSDPAPSGPAGPWSCVPVGSRRGVSSILETERGALWLTARDRGLLAWNGRAFEPVPAAAALPVRDLRNVVASPRGGQWLMGLGAVTRVVDGDQGLEVAELLPEWLGQSLAGIEGLYEDPDGTLWLGANVGLVRVPARIRDRPATGPVVRLSELRVDGVVVTPDGVVRLPTPESSVSIQASAVSFRAPNLVRYRQRLDGAAWTASQPATILTFSRLPSGAHTVEVAASMDGQRWSTPPLAIGLWVPSRWHERAGVWAVAAAVVLLGLLVVQQARMRLQAREQRLRTQVAGDLHDELGAGLAGIGLLAGLIADGSAVGQAQRLAARIVNEAEELGAALSSIVWSLRPGHGDLEALFAYIEHRAHAVLPSLAANGAVHVARSADHHGRGVDPDVSRALQLVVLEGLHNVARHADATRVWVRMERSGGEWRLVVEDDGVGMEGEALAAPDRGLGLSSMSARVRAVGGRLEVGPRPGGGTRLIATVRLKRRWWSSGGA